MNITVFTSNQRRHVSLIKILSEVSDTVYALQEVTTLFPGEIDDFYRDSSEMSRYFSKVRDAEQDIFGNLTFLPSNVLSMSVKMGDLNLLPLSFIDDCLHSDLIIVFGASYLRGDLAKILVSKRAINIHMGVSPYYRGNSCNFWAMYDNRPEYVGASIQYLTQGLDTGPIIFHALPSLIEEESSFNYTMRAVRIAQLAIVSRLEDLVNHKLKASEQDIKKQIRYSRRHEFTDEIASKFLSRDTRLSCSVNKETLRDLGHFINPYVG